MQEKCEKSVWQYGGLAFFLYLYSLLVSMMIGQGLFEGLSEAEVVGRRAREGENVLTPPRRPSAWALYLDKLRDPVIRVLLVAAVVSFGIGFYEGDFVEPIGIVCAVVLATGIGFIFEYDAGRRFEALNELGAETCVRVVRGGVVREVWRREVVRGDVVLLESGDEVPADGVCLWGEGLMVDESRLTGELVSAKDAAGGGEGAYGREVLLRGSTVVEGSGVMRVTAVGDATEIGRVAQAVTGGKKDEATPLSRQLGVLAGWISKVGMVVAAVVFVVFTVRGLWGYMYGGDVVSWWHVAYIVVENFMLAVTLMVMVVPEGLPMAVTLSLALNMRRMLRANVLVRKLHACETMGAVTVICTDKTGTLTENRMRVDELMALGDAELLAGGVACNSTAFLDGDGDGGLGNPTEVALLRWLRERGVDYEVLRGAHRRVCRVPFSSERKYMATCVEWGGGGMVFVKGAPELLLPLCAGLGEEERARVRARLSAWQGEARRTLLLACKEGMCVDADELRAVVRSGGLRLLGVCGISDPVRAEVPEAVRCVEGAGVDVKVVTGDGMGTALEVGRRIGLLDGVSDVECMSGVEFAKMSDEEARGRVVGLRVMYRARPSDKLRLVTLLRGGGAVVAVTGDGTNDAPALRQADVGLSMGSGTSVAKEASDVTLLDDSFSSVVCAVEWGRGLYENLQRFVVFQLTINFTALLVVLLGSCIGTALPLTVTQILWINIIMDTFAALALSTLPARRGVMGRPPRSARQFIITPVMGRRIVGYGMFFVIILLGMLLWFGGCPDVEELTVFFTVFVMMQFWNLLNAKAFESGCSVFRGLRECKGLWLVLGLILVGQVFIVQYGGAVFRTVPLPFLTWVWIVVGTSVVLWLGEVVRWLLRRVER